ncbi:hypothetical protein [Breznakia pachnodae]|uniref:Uncharacterized protein n=1 Tax=Breznakia pachnodae TaxID=265178 RepID=A0ABU0E3X6_9FIRM|nr:hypothetical protein [Breznakia pachnodae]MDQ0361585.1 hypothetical protein [Breznakia pachnodae]
MEEFNSKDFVDLYEALPLDGKEKLQIFLKTVKPREGEPKHSDLWSQVYDYLDNLKKNGTQFDMHIGRYTSYLVNIIEKEYIHLLFDFIDDELSHKLDSQTENFNELI